MNEQVSDRNEEKMRKIFTAIVLVTCCIFSAGAQINTDRILNVGRNALYFEDYILSIQYFNQVIKVKPYLAEPYFYRAVAKISLDDYQGALEDASLCIERNPFIINTYQVRGIAYQNLEQYDKAIADYKKGLEFSPENRTFLLNMAIAYAQKKEYDKALTGFDNLIDIHPNYYNGYISRSAIFIEKGDTVSAVSDLDKAIKIDKHSSAAFARRAMIKAQLEEYKPALEDINTAIRLDPTISAYYINRGLIKYHMNDLRGTMADYDQVIEVDKNNIIAYYNRGLLRAQVGDRNRAIDDFSNVIRLESDNFFAYYNRAILCDEIGDLNGALNDYTTVLGEYPKFLPAMYARSNIYRRMNELKKAEADYMAAYNMEKEMLAQREASKRKPGQAGNTLAKNDEDEDSDEEKVRKQSDKNIQKFNRILVADNESAKSKYNSEIRGRVQDKNVSVELEESFVLSYYEKGESVRQNIYFDKSISDFNRANALARRLKPTNSEASLTTFQVEAHFASVDNNSRLIDISPNNPLPYFARSLDFMLVQDFENAISDLNHLLALRDNFVLGYFNRAAIRMKQLEAGIHKDDALQSDDNMLNMNLTVTGKKKQNANSNNGDRMIGGVNNRGNLRNIEFELMMRDYDKVIQLDPKFVYAYYNRANVYCAQKDYKLALLDYSTAIELYPEFAEALFNRGLVYFYLGENDKAVSDLSKAGELGIVAAYNIIKRAAE